MPTVRIPTPLRNLTGGEAEVVVDGDDLRSAIKNLDAAHPGIAERLLDGEGQLRRYVNVFVRDVDVRFQDGLDTALSDTDVVSVVPAVAGGAV